MDMTHPLTPEACRRAAHERLQRRDPETAEQFFRHLLELLPHDVEALSFLASRHYARGELVPARDLSLHAVAREPERVDLLQLLGAVQLANGDFGDAAGTLQRSLQLAPQAFVARLQLGVAQEQLGRAHDALVTWYTAIRTAQNQGRWTNDQTTAPAVRELVKIAEAQHLVVLVDDVGGNVAADDLAENGISHAAWRLLGCVFLHGR